MITVAQLPIKSYATTDYFGEPTSIIRHDYPENNGMIKVFNRKDKKYHIIPPDTLVYYFNQYKKLRRPNRGVNARNGFTGYNNSEHYRWLCGFNPVLVWLSCRGKWNERRYGWKPYKYIHFEDYLENIGHTHSKHRLGYQRYDWKISKKARKLYHYYNKYAK